MNFAKRITALLLAALLMASGVSSAFASESDPVGSEGGESSVISEVQPEESQPEESQPEESQPEEAGETEKKFPDVGENKWYTPAVTYLAGLGVITGMPDGTFQPQRNVTRAEFVKMLAVLSDKEITSRQDRNTFADVSASSWHEGYIRWGIKEKFIIGRSDTVFDPQGYITRQELAVLLWRFNKNVMGKAFPTWQKINFKDKGSISSWASVEVEAVTGAGLMQGYSDRTFVPKGKATRAEVAQVLYKYNKSISEYENRCQLDAMRYIMHGGGQVGTAYTTNSLEALNESYKNNHTIIEMDFSWTTDNRLVCIHQWGGEYPQRTTLVKFLGQKLPGGLTSMGLDELGDWVRGRKDVWIIPDIKESNLDALRHIARYYPDLVERFVPYVYHTSEYQEVYDMGYRNILLILYQMKASEKKDSQALVQFARQNNLAGIVIDPNVDSGIYAPAKSAGIPVLPYVVDSAQLMYSLSQQGADGFFTDKQSVTIEW